MENFYRKSPPILSKIEVGSFDFSLALYNALKEPDTNFVVSPFSLTSALTMSLMGARSNTGQEMSKTLFDHVFAEEEFNSLAEEFKSLIEKAVKANDSVMSVANFMYSKVGYPIIPDFAETLKKNFAAEIKGVDFAKKEETADIINKDISNATNGKISKIIDASDLDSELTRLILANAVYFKGLWKNQFLTRETSKMKFTLISGEQIDVDMMSQNKHYHFGKSDQLKCKALIMPYENCNIKLVLFLPDEDSSLAFLEAKLTQPLLLNLLRSKYCPEVYVQLPRFKVKSTFDLKSHLMKLGILSAFENDADFTGISPKADHLKEGLKISKVFQKAGIEVDEKGTEAYAATFSMHFVPTSSAPYVPPPVEYFYVDRPFMFLLVSEYDDKQLILFMGSVKNPLE